MEKTKTICAQCERYVKTKNLGSKCRCPTLTIDFITGNPDVLVDCKVKNDLGDCPDFKYRVSYIRLDDIPLTVLNEADKVINGERQDQYGNPEDSFELIAKYWDLYLTQDLIKNIPDGRCATKESSISLTAKDVAHMMILMKLARTAGQRPKRDNYIDIVGYAAIAGDRLTERS